MNTGLAGLPTSGTQAQSGINSGRLPLIETKIQIPRRQPDLLPRPRLVSFLHTHLDRKLLLVSAPAGYGKTSLLVDFAHDTDLPVCWYTLDPFDRDLRVFLEYLIAAIALRFPAFGERSRAFLQEVAAPGHNLYSLVATFVQEIYDTIPEYFVLVLDDHHAIKKQEQINEFLDLLLTYAGENCHLILASRTLPALPNLSLLVARRQAAGLSIDELRFAPREIQALARQNYDLELTGEQAGELADRTGGWITGLLLTVAPRWEQIQDMVPLRGRIDVGIYDYLSRQVLEWQPAPLRRFLLDSSVLDEMDPALCSAVLDVPRSRATAFLDQLRTRNLFVIEFEGDDARLRYHDLFREFLQATLLRQDEGHYQELTRRAAQIYAEREDWDRAIGRYLALHDYEQVVAIVEQRATPMFQSGRWDTLTGWLDALPEAVRDARPHLLVLRGRIYMERGEHALALAQYDRADRAFAAAGDSIERAFVLSLKGYVLRFQGDYAEAVVLCREALALIGGETAREMYIRATVHKNMGFCQLRMGQRAKGQETLHQALRSYEIANSIDNVALVHHDLGLSYELGGDLDRAMQHYRTAIRHWEALGSLGYWADTLNGLGVIYYLRGQYDEAQRILEEALSKARQIGYLRVEAVIWASLGDMHRDLGAYERAWQAYSEGLQAASRAGEGFVITYALDALGNTHRLQGDLAQAGERLSEAMERAQKHESPYEIGLCHTSLGILACQQGHLPEARHHLEQAVEIFAGGGFERDLARAYLHRAQVAFLAGERERALADLARTLEAVAHLGFDQFLVVEGQRLQPLLRYAVGQPSFESVLSDLLRRIEIHGTRAKVQVEPIVEAEAQQLEIHALGFPQVTFAGERVQWATVQSRNLLFCLLQHRRGLRKEEIEEMFWPNHPPHKLTSLFHSTFYRLRRALFQESVIFEEGLYRFNRDTNYWLDVEDFDRLLAQAGREQDKAKKEALIEEATSLYRGDYLEGVYADWTTLDREQLLNRYLTALDTLANLYAERGALEEAIETYQCLLARDRYQEAAHRGLMNCFQWLGDRAAAIRQYQTCAAILRKELGLSPMPETEELYRQIID